MKTPHFIYRNRKIDNLIFLSKTRKMSTISSYDKLVISEQPITIRGWVFKIMSKGKMTFLHIRSGALKSQKIQVFVHSKVCQSSEFTTESYVEITGKVTQLPTGKYSYYPFEVIASSVKVLSKAKSDFSSRYPDTASIEYKMEDRHMHIREPKMSLMIKLRDAVIQSLVKYFYSVGMTQVFPPSFVSQESEGGASLFKLQHPGTSGEIQAYLTQSSQFYLEYALPAVGDCFCIAPSFRAEKSHTRRHLTEFLHAECEWKDVDSLETHIDKLKHMMKGIVHLLLEDHSILLEEAEILERVKDLYQLTQDILILSHDEAIRKCTVLGIYKDDEHKIPFDERDDIPESQERKLIDTLGKIVFLTSFPVETKSFYMEVLPYDKSRVAGVDIEVPLVGEVVGSGIRCGDVDELVTRLKLQGMSDLDIQRDYKEYLDLRRYGFGRTSGMGLGVDRFLTWITGSYHIREVVTFPRYAGYIRP